jgi:hypothetical protein
VVVRTPSASGGKVYDVGVGGWGWMSQTFHFWIFFFFAI